MGAGGGFPLTSSGAAEGAWIGGKDSVSHGGPGSGCGSSPGKRRQQPFV